MKSRLKKVAEINKEAAYMIGRNEEELLEKFPNAQKISEYMYKVRENGMIYHIAYDSAVDAWKVFLRSKTESNVVQKAIEYFTDLFGI